MGSMVNRVDHRARTVGRAKAPFAARWTLSHMIVGALLLARLADQGLAIQVGPYRAAEPASPRRS